MALLGFSSAFGFGFGFGSGFSSGFSSGFGSGFGFGFSQLNFAQKETLSPVGLRVSGKAPGDDLLSHGLSHTTIGAAA
ncbi:hypothetical protein, partial [Xanthomonas arboricola]|uniref:hypothetical protein n=1 Tax=Xanthomonas arboricola TaxID=56448 RepID=UPI001CA4EFB9